MASVEDLIPVVVFLAIAVIAIISVRRESKKKRMARCPICRESIQIGLNLSPHFRSVHPEYARWTKRWGIGTVLVLVSSILLLFLLFFLDILPARERTPPPRTIYGVIAFFVLFVFFIAFAALQQLHKTRLLGQKWAEEHRGLITRRFGNLNGMRAEVRRARGRLSKLTLPLAILEPIWLAFEAIQWLVMRRVELDRFEDDTLYYYGRGNMPGYLELRNRTLELVDDRRIRIKAHKVSVEIRTETSSDMDQLFSVLRAGEIALEWDTVPVNRKTLGLTRQDNSDREERSCLGLEKKKWECGGKPPETRT